MAITLHATLLMPPAAPYAIDADDAVPPQRCQRRRHIDTPIRFAISRHFHSHFAAMAMPLPFHAITLIDAITDFRRHYADFLI